MANKPRDSGACPITILGMKSGKGSCRQAVQLDIANPIASGLPMATTQSQTIEQVKVMLKKAIAPRRRKRSRCRRSRGRFPDRHLEACFKTRFAKCSEKYDRRLSPSPSRSTTVTTGLTRASCRDISASGKRPVHRSQCGLLKPAAMRRRRAPIRQDTARGRVIYAKTDLDGLAGATAPDLDVRTGRSDGRDDHDGYHGARAPVGRRRGRAGEAL